jgi:hypothetical protein
MEIAQRVPQESTRTSRDPAIVRVAPPTRTARLKGTLAGVILATPGVSIVARHVIWANIRMRPGRTAARTARWEDTLLPEVRPIAHFVLQASTRQSKVLRLETCAQIAQDSRLQIQVAQSAPVRQVTKRLPKGNCSALLVMLAKSSH